MRVVQAYKYALDPNTTATAALFGHCGAARFAYNHMLARVKAVLDQRTAETSYGLTGDALTPALNWSAYGLRKDWNRRKNTVAVDRDTGMPWWSEYSKEAYASATADLAAALKNWSASRSGRRAGKPMGFPRFKRRRGDAVGSVRFTTGTIRLEGRTRVVLPVIGPVKTHESTRKLARRIEAGTARIMAATIKRERRRWWVVFTCEVDRCDPPPRLSGTAVGVDLGVKTLAVTSDGIAHPNPKHLTRHLARLRRESRRVSRRRGPDRRSGFTGSARWHRANRTRNRVQYRVADARRDSLHQLTSHLTGAYGAIGVEDLHVAGMLRNRRLSRAIADAGFATLRHQLGYKTAWRGSVFAVAERWYPSSKTCCGCKAVKTKLPLHVRVFECEFCGLVLDRDVNAARNLADQVYTLFPEWPGEVKRGRGGDVRPTRWAVASETSTRRPPLAVQGPPGGNARITEHHRYSSER
ncbi:IS607 family element RNA-guided endonuclease TnpB [Nocardia otitidiscaviarum]|uniref:IS607 family element RNA-guided endonuclease TnpB n=1 Tax=Nocardia otitidiscaviarum TaxID=1823 RepID=UPI002B4B3123|nr:IS607 family element RNA-guided endonuclease TnpB [Nocardia otitidiscaviarum]